MSTVTNRHRALAIVDLRRELIVGAWHRIAAQRSLELACVPAHDIRHALDRRVDQSAQAMIQIDGWDRARGTILVICGTVGSGKSFAATRWLYRRQRRGQAGRWLACST